MASGETCAHTLICALVIALVAVNQANAVMTKEQIEKTSTTLRNTCASKVNANTDVVLAMRQGQFPEDPALKCYTHCIMKTVRTFKNGRVDDAMLIKQMELMMPADIVGPMKETAKACASAPVGGDDCETTFNFVKCSYEKDPANFFFP